MGIPFALLCLSTFLTCALLILLLRIKNKKMLHHSALGLVFVVLLWCIVTLGELYITSIHQNNGMLFTNLLFSITGFLPVSLFIFGFNYAYQESKWRSRICWLLLVPAIGAALIWTNDYHHLCFIQYTSIDADTVFGPYLQVYPYFAYILIILGLFFLIKYSIKNSGFFSRQSLLIIAGVILPLAIDITYVFRIYPIPFYYEAISFSFAMVCVLISIFWFGLFRISPIALQTVVDHISDSYFVINEQEVIIDFNKPFVDNFHMMTGVARKDHLKDFLEKLDHVSFVKYDGFMESVREAISNKTTVTFENQYITNGFDKTFTVEITPIFSRDIHKGTVILLKDITEQRRSFEMIRQTQIMLIESEHLASLGQLVGGIAHNLKTPIMSISGGLVGLSDLIDEYEESVSDDTVTVEDHHEIANEMRTWIGKMKEYTAYMSDVISTVKGQAVQLTASTTDSFILKELLKRVDILMNHELKKYGCRLNVRCMIDQGTKIKGEINSFVQVINNLILNSIEAYEGKEGDIDFTISKNESEQIICFEVRDSGCGMTEEIKKKLFKEMITTKAKNGTGLGLYMSYSTITGRFGGKMWFESVYGMGTTFYIMVPAV
jgi:two-component system sensor histidine kinase HupT/HoxJ